MRPKLIHWKPCRRCGETLRFDSPERKCVQCYGKPGHDYATGYIRRPARMVGLATDGTRRSYHTFNVSDAQYKAQLALQNNLCPICLTTLHDPVVDHCHATNRVRMILCRKCNVALGMLNDNPAALRRAADYVERFK